MNRVFYHLWLTLWVGVLLFSEACQFSSTQTDAQYAWLGSTPQDSMVWRRVQQFDPYQGGVITPQDSNNPYFLVLYTEGNFRSLDKYAHQQGIWQLREDKQALALEYDASPAVARLPLSGAAFRHQIRRMSQDTLILAWQGRHGFVEELYISADEVPDSVWNPETLSE